ncbi:MAG: hypothetical protein KAH54_09185 [Candidatus Sabulitectum sp.]|nr:hypothetical protein [Candidatus Sabulitectum sp.]
MKFPAFVLIIASIAVAQFPDTLLGSVSVGQNPSDVCLSPDGSRAYVAVKFGFATAIDINGFSDFSLAGLVAIDGEPVTLECDASGDYLYVADQENNVVHVINTSTLTVESSFTVQPSPTDMVLCSEENTIYLSHETGMLTVIDTEAQMVEECFWAGEEINSLAVTPLQDMLFAADDGSSQEAVINPSTGFLTHFNSGMDSYCCTVSGDGTKLFLSCRSWNLIGVMDIPSLTVYGTIPCPEDAPDKMVVLPDLPYLYGVCPEQNTVTVYGTSDLTWKGDIPISGGPANIAVHPDGERLFVVCTGDNRIKVIGFDQSGIDTPLHSHILSVVDSPSPSPSVTVTCSEGGTVALSAIDLSGRTVWTAETVIAQNETRQFHLGNVPTGVLIVTSTIRGTVNSVKVIAL